MGNGHILRCKKCGYELKPHLGVGFLFPEVYQETIAEAKDGKYGKNVQTFLKEHPDGVLNCDKVLLQCHECGMLETEMDLSMYVPKQDTVPQERIRWSVAFPFGGAYYVAPWELDNYELISHFEHKCKICGAKMKRICEKDLEKEPGEFLCCPRKTRIKCPRCGKPLWNTGRIMWD